MRRWDDGFVRGLSALVAALLSLSGCEGGRDRGGFGQAPPPTVAPASPEPESNPERPPALVRVQAMEGYRFEPVALEVRAGQPVEFELTNMDGQEHTFVVSELAVVMLAGAGQTVRTEVAIGRRNTGLFEYFCSIGGHREAGMEGVIRVLPR